MDEPTGSSRRRLILVIAGGVLIIAGVVAATLIKHSSEPVRSVTGTCAQLSQAKDLDRSLASLDPATLRDRFTALENAVAIAPADIEPQIATLSVFISGLIGEIDRAPGPDRRAALADALAGRAEQIDSITAAGAAVQDWAATNCQLELGDASTTSSSSVR